LERHLVSPYALIPFRRCLFHNILPTSFFFKIRPGMEISYAIIKVDAVYYRGLLEKAWGEAAFVFRKTV
jgi:hypothetical protein